jgi:hypothetical protein
VCAGEIIMILWAWLTEITLFVHSFRVRFLIIMILWAWLTEITLCVHSFRLRFLS